MDLQKIRELIRLAEETGLVELEVRSGDDSIRFVRAGQPGSTAAAPNPPATAAAGSGRVDVLPVVAPMAGTFYAAPEPGATPFVQVGQTVAVGDVLCIIESMKMLHEIFADRAGTVTLIAVAEGQPVGTGDLLFRLA
jgi:acetyl-CoA carboxylase biotin carboxyl carrier protein